MCGIVVAIGDSSKIATAGALERIIHRGRDGSKILASIDSQFGFNRLAIQDKSAQGMQPFVFEHYIGVFNGEIYNAADLRIAHHLVTNSFCDTEVILPLFAKYGPKVIHHLDGFFAGVIQNQKTGAFYLLRDAMGKKPLFYCTSGDRGWIVSELKALDNVERFEIVPKGASVLKDGKLKVCAVHSVVGEGMGELRERIIAAVHKRSPTGEDRFGLFLSGGLDSSILAAIVSKLPFNVTYYTLGGFQDADSQFVQELAEHLGIEAQVRYVRRPSPSQVLGLIESVVYHTESYNPSVVSNGLATYLLSQAAHHDKVRVVLSGEGADELFCGYLVSKDVDYWFSKRAELMENMHFTELRRLDLASMAHTVELRCPFLDRQVLAAAMDCKASDLIGLANGVLQGKQILRSTFSDLLPRSILERSKVSFDVGSGIRRLVVDSLLASGLTETERLKEIWQGLFPSFEATHPYFSMYPVFESAIAQRGKEHR